MSSIDSVLNEIGLGKFHFLTLFGSGIMYACSSSQTMIFAFIAPILSCQWRNNATESSFLSNAVFIGAIFGSPLMGALSDKFGRKRIIIVGTIGLLYTGILSAMAPTISWMILIRCLVGFFACGNLGLLYSLSSESTPVKYRGIFLVCFQIFWGLGSFWIALLGVITTSLSWRVFLLLSNIPNMLAILITIWISESPRFLLLNNEKYECLKIINKIAQMNNKKSINEIPSESISKSRYMDIIHPKYLWTVVACCILSFNSGTSYYGFVSLVSIIYDVPHKCLENMSREFHPFTDVNATFIDNSCCSNIFTNNFKNILISATAEIIFAPLSIFLISFIGRKRSMSVYLLVASIGFIVLNFCIKDSYLSILIFILRGCSKCISNTLHVYTIEVLPTSVRSVGFGIFGCLHYTGSTITSILINIVLARYSFLAGTMVYFVLNMICLIITFLLPYETLNRGLNQTADDDASNEHLNRNKTVKNYSTVKD